MKYVSTRGNMPEKSFTEVLVMGLCPDGGLAVPKSIPKILSNDLLDWQSLSYQDLCYKIFSLFIDDIPSTDLKTIINKVYCSNNFLTDEITPLDLLTKNLAILGLSNGPTFAFKDIAMQMIGELFEYVLVKNNKRMNIVGATSGDTGSAAEYAMIGKNNIQVFMLSPHKRMSPFQQAQMFGLDEPNIYNLSVDGVFDDCQDIVKAINNDLSFKKEHNIGAVNSINWARILAQIVYYFKGYFAAIKDNKTEVSFCVPSGNFGNAYAGFIAKQMGLPIKNLIVATNENDVLNDFFATGKYIVRASKDVLETTSPSMDIGKASNFERYIYDLMGSNSNLVNVLWDKLDKDQQFTIEDMDLVKKAGIISGVSTAKNRLQEIDYIYSKFNKIIDPHTADGVYVARQKNTQGLTICLETALPIKFEDTIEKAIGMSIDKTPEINSIMEKEKHYLLVENSTNKVKHIIVDNDNI